MRISKSKFKTSELFWKITLFVIIIYFMILMLFMNLLDFFFFCKNLEIKNELIIDFMSLSFLKVYYHS